jgi:uncharacterized protein with FMN-binding domain
MRRAILAFVGTVAGLVVLLTYKTAPSQSGTRPAALAPAAPDKTTAPSPSTSSGTSTTPSPRTSSGTTTLDGKTIQTPYGPVQVRVTMNHGKLSDVTAVQLPNDTMHSQQISSYAAPILRQEARKAKSAHIDIVSGATYTSDGYAQSLQSALDHG